MMEELARGFVEYVKQKHPGKCVLVFCDNLSAHLADSVKQIFKDGGCTLCFLPPDLTEAVQPIDAGYGRSVRCTIGNLLDDWLMQDENMEIWEKGMTASERRVLISSFVEKATNITLEKDDMRIGCCIRSDCLMTEDGSDDDKIKPQSLTKKVVIDTRYLSEQEVIDYFGGGTMNAVSNETLELCLTFDDTNIYPTLEPGDIDEVQDIIIEEDEVIGEESDNEILEEESDNEEILDETIKMLNDLPNCAQKESSNNKSSSIASSTSSI